MLEAKWSVGMYYPGQRIVVCLCVSKQLKHTHGGYEFVCVFVCVYGYLCFAGTCHIVCACVCLAVLV